MASTPTAGDDSVVSGQGNDTVSGGTGADLFLHDGGTGVMRILDFDADADHLQIPAAAGFADGAAAGAALVPGQGGAVLTLASGGTVVFVGLAPAAFTIDDFLIV